MIVKILKNATNGFPGISYNAGKVDRGKGELMKVSNFGALQGLTKLKPADYVNYLKAFSDVNSRVRKAQFHAVLSSKGDLYNKKELTQTAEKWLREMGYGNQPYLIVFHKDTANNHVHMVTTRVGRDGKKISSAFEKVRAVRSLEKVLGYDHGLNYRFSTKAQFYLILERNGYVGKDLNEEKLLARIEAHVPDKGRATELRSILTAAKDRPGLLEYLKTHHDLELVMHSAPGKAPYGYTVLDHRTKQVFKGSEILRLQQLLDSTKAEQWPQEPPLHLARDFKHEEHELYSPPAPVYVRPVSIADDIDDEAILGRNRRRKRKARTNTR